MSCRYLNAVAAVCLLGFSAPFAMALAKWTKFTDPTREISVMLPTPVQATQSLSGSAAYKADDGEVTYIVNFRRKSLKNPGKDQSNVQSKDQINEIQTFCSAFAKGFEEVEVESGRKTKINLVSEVAGKNWQGRIYRYIKPSGDSGAFEIAIAGRHNFVLHAVGSADTAPNTKRFFSSFEVN